MSILDQRDCWVSVDPQSMRSLLESFPEHVQIAAENGRNLTLQKSKDVHVILVTGLGGSAIGGDLMRSIAEGRLKIPVIVNRNYDLPAFVTEATLVFACSYSGNTEETLSAYRQSRQRKAAIVCITSGGQLESMANADGYPVVHLPDGLPPRAALGYALIALLSAMQKMHILPGMEESIEETITLLGELRNRYRTDNLEPGNPAKKLAGALHRKIVAVYGSTGIMEAAAYRWRSQIAENAKNLAFHHVLPEMNHNELVGWQHPEEVLRKIGVVFLRDKGDHPQTQRRFDLVKGIIGDKAGTIHEVWSEGESLMARILSVVYLGDFVSLYLSYLNNVDPTPVEVIDYLKRNLRT
ncbi:MAG: bifunctional phosphoglucose/phosphomannose isomerase [Acidobacteria bacterium]|nr:bifunctional phosphoglucose/phosphomannose isomerase [Acidobacteriota bacterium]